MVDPAVAPRAGCVVPHILHGVLEELAIRQELPDREAFVRRTTDELARLCDAG